MSVITTVLPAKSDHLEQAWLSLREQSLPKDWSWEWILQFDGPEPLRWEQPDDDRIRVQRSDRTWGPAISRNLGLGRASGSLVKVLDADDMLSEGQLGREVGVFGNHTNVGWVTSRALDLLPDGQLAGFAGDPDEGVLQRGSIVDYWRDNDNRACVHPATLTMRSSLLLALGGWMALPSSEDTGLLLALNTVADGYFLGTPGLYYRKWPKQLTAEDGHRDPESRARRFRLIDKRIDALAEAGFDWR